MRPLSLLVAGLAALGAAAQEPARPGLLVLPWVTLGPGVPTAAVGPAQAMLADALGREAAFELLTPAAQDAAAPVTALDEARRAVDEARTLWSRHALVAADEALDRAVTAFRAAAPALAGPAELSDALALRAAVRRGLGRDAEAATALRDAVALGPARELPLGRTSPGFARAAREAAAAARRGSTGSLRLESAPAFAAVRLDGQAVGTTPLEVQGVPPGPHLWQLRLPQGTTLGGVVEVSASATASVRGEAPASGPLERLLRTLVQGRLDRPSLDEAASLARARGATWVLAAALQREEAGLGLEVLLLEPAAGQVRQLPRSHFDVELLSAAGALADVARALSAGRAAGVQATLPVSVGTPATARAAVVPYPRGRGAVDEAEEEAPAEPTAAPRRRVPLRPP
jgi:hypothetical protein